VRGSGGIPRWRSQDVKTTMGGGCLRKGDVEIRQGQLGNSGGRGATIYGFSWKESAAGRAVGCPRKVIKESGGCFKRPEEGTSIWSMMEGYTS